MKGFGILLLALGKKRYGELAYNLAMAIKHKNPDTRICVVTDGKAIDNLPTLSFFDELVTMPEEYYIFDGKPHYYTAKLYLDLVSPFETTLYIDVDVMLFDNFVTERVLHFVKEQVFQPMITTCVSLTDKEAVSDMGKGITSLWYRKSEELIKLLGLEGNMYMSNSTMLMWNKSDSDSELADNELTEDSESITSADIFECARWLRSRPDVCKYTFVTGDIGDYPDEFFFNVAMCYLKYKPKYKQFAPVFMDWFHKDKSRKDILSKYLGVNMNGFGKLPYHLIDLYNFFVNKYNESFVGNNFNSKMRKILWIAK